MEEMIEKEQPQTCPRGVPVDLTKEEYIDYYMTVARMFGTLKMQKPSMILFAVYAVITIVFTVMVYVQDGVLDWLMLAVLGVTLVSAALTYFLLPARIRRKAAMLYDAGNTNGYYGELIVNRLEITKLVSADEQVTVPLDDKAMFIETDKFIALFTAGSQKAIILPPRCVTPALASAVREAVFAEGSRIHRRVMSRMPAAATATIEARELPAAPRTLYTCEVTFEPDEIKAQIKDTGTKQYVDSLPTVVVFAMLVGSMMAMIGESILWFFIAALAVVIGMLLLSMLSSSAKAKQASMQGDNIRMRFELTERGVVITSRGADRKVFMQWNSLKYVTAFPEYVEFSGLDQIVRIPKRHIDDFEEFSAVVDAHFPPKQ